MKAYRRLHARVGELGTVPRMLSDYVAHLEAGSRVVLVKRESDPDTGSLIDFTCDSGECTADCIPDAVTVSVTTYEFRRFVGFLGLPPVPIPDFRTSLPMESAGCDPEQAVCLP